MGTTGFLQRTCNCGQLRMADAGREVILNGWIQRRRDLGGLIFIDLRDRYGITQVVFNPRKDKDLFKMAESLRNEFVIAVKGLVNKRPEGSENEKIDTGEIEIWVDQMEILSRSKALPFMVADDLTVDESHRLKYRFIDLRRAGMQRNIILRHRFTQAVRQFLNDNDFLEIETPMLIRSTPEGARDFLVPSRLTQGAFFALPQSPQLLKQLLMCSGFDRYYQLARCFRDEDLRADRQLEFTQIDLEMSFVKRDDVLSMVEKMLAFALKQTLDINLHLPLPRMTWQEAMDRYGIDKPDTRFNMEIVDITDALKDTTFKVIQDVIESGGRVRGIRLPGCASFSRKQVDELSDFVKKFGVQGILPVALKPDGIKSPLAKHINEHQVQDIMSRMDAEEGDLLALLAGDTSLIAPILGKLRLMMGRQLNLIDKSRHAFLWITDFPMFAWNEEEQRIEPEHHAFTSPNQEDMDKMESAPLKVRAQAYDLVFNGNEAASGSIRIHDRDLQELVFKTIGLSREEAGERFGFLLDAFEYGVPPHGGIALGHDRIIAELAGEESIRDVIAFPKNSGGQCLLSGAPVQVGKDQLDVLGVEVKPVGKAKEKEEVLS